jgi:hypothetical protein
VRAPVELNRTERSDAEAAHATVLELHLMKELPHCRERFCRLARRYAALLEQLMHATADGADELRPACLDRSEDLRASCRCVPRTFEPTPRH